MDALAPRDPAEDVVDDLLREVGGVLDPVALGQRVAEAVGRRLPLPLVSLALRQGRHGPYAMRCTWGARTEAFRLIRLTPGQGLGGRALADSATTTVEDYGTDERITSHFRAVVRDEGLHGMAAVPVFGRDEPLAVIYGGRHEHGRPDDRTVQALQRSTAVLAPVLESAFAAQEHAALRVEQERQRIAGELHDEVGQLLFAISAAAGRARELEQDRATGLNGMISRIEQLAVEATDRLRTSLRALSPATPGDRLPVAIRRDLDDLSDRSGIVTHLVLPRRAVPLPAGVERALLSCLRQALFNIERHAMAGLVVATLDMTPHQVSLTVQDDGVGLPAGFEPGGLPEDGSRWGWASMSRQVEQLGGTVSLGNVESGGARLLVRLPLRGVAR